jgi:DNA (cytosine-5)-methyltransferase 1
MQSQITHKQFNINFSRVQAPAKEGKITFGEFFAGGGGFTEGAEQVDEVETRWILNHDPIALKTNAFHHEGLLVYCADIYAQDEHELEYVDWVHASIECKDHSKAKGGKKKKIGSYMMGLELVRYLKFLQPLVISIENVPEFKKWGPLDENGDPIKALEGQCFEEWKQTIIGFGYEYQESIRNAADDGLPTRRERYFAFFYRPGIAISFPEFTHAKDGVGGKLPWEACRPHIDTDDVGNSMFGRKFNMDLLPQQRKPLVPNSQRRIAGGIKKTNPVLFNALSQFIAQYHAGVNPERSQSLDAPINVIDGSNRHQLATVIGGDLLQFVQDHCQTDNYHTLDEPMRPQLSWQTKQLVMVEKLKFILDHCHSTKYQSLSEPLGVLTAQESKRIATVESGFITQYYGGSIQSNKLDEPLNAVTDTDRHQYVNVEDPLFIAKYYNAGGNPESQVQSLDDSLGAILETNHLQLVRVEKLQFIAEYFNSNGKPEYNVHGLDEPLSPVTTEFKHQLVTLLDDFDIKVRFLRRDELAGCSTFPRDYFDHPELGLSHKSAVSLIGRAVPPLWGTILLKNNVRAVLDFKCNRKEVA